MLMTDILKGCVGASSVKVVGEEVEVVLPGSFNMSSIFRSTELNEHLQSA
jgi:hypothetical protein